MAKRMQQKEEPKRSIARWRENKDLQEMCEELQAIKKQNSMKPGGDGALRPTTSRDAM